MRAGGRVDYLYTTVGFYLFASRVPKRVIVVLQRLGVSSSYSHILHILEMAAQSELAKTRIRVRNQPCMLLYDNFNIYSKVQDERIHNKDIQHNNTVGAVVFLKTQQGDPWSMRLPQDKQTVSRAEQHPNLLDAHSGDQSGLVLATVSDRHFGYGSESKANRCQLGGPGRQYTRTAQSGTVPWITPNPSELSGLSAGRPVGPSIDSHKALEFAVC